MPEGLGWAALIPAPGGLSQCNEAQGSAGAAKSSAKLLLLALPSCQVGNCVFLNSTLPWPCPKINLHSLLPCVVLHKTKRPFLFVWQMNSAPHAAAGAAG